MSVELFKKNKSVSEKLPQGCAMIIIDHSHTQNKAR